MRAVALCACAVAALLIAGAAFGTARALPADYPPAPSPTATVVPSPTPTPPRPSPTPSPTPSPSVSSPPFVYTPVPFSTTSPPGPVVFSSPLPPGQVVTIVNGVAQPSNVTVRDQQVVVSSGGAQLRLVLENSNGERRSLTPDGSLVVAQEGATIINGTGFAPETLVGVYALSTPTLLGRIPVNARGELAGAVAIPTTLPPGRHTLQASGFTPGGAALAISLPLLVTAAPAVDVTTVQVAFAPGSTNLRRGAKGALIRLAASVPASKRGVTVLVVGFRKVGTADRKLARQRAKVVGAFLQAQGMPGDYRIRGNGKTSEKGRASRQVIVRATVPR